MKKIKYCIKCNKKVGKYSKHCRKCYIKIMLKRIHKIDCGCFICKAKRGDYKGSKNPNAKIKGHKYISNGYKFITYDYGKRITEHKYKVEKYLNRKLRKGETLHHIDGNTFHNSLKNLYLFPKAGLHSCFENLRKYNIIQRKILKSNLRQIKIQEKR